MGTIYRFITRTILYNSIEFTKVASKKTFAAFAKYRNSLTIAILLIILLAVGFFIVKDGGDPFLMPFPLIIGFIFIAPILLIFNIIAVIFNLTSGEETYEPKIVRWVGRMISNFFKDATRSLDEQEVLDRKEKEKIRKKKERRRIEKEAKKNEEREAKKAKENIFNRFEVMEID